MLSASRLSCRGAPSVRGSISVLETYTLQDVRKHERHHTQHSCRMLTSDGYIHKAKIPTYHFQKSLPKLPLPALDKTLDRYLLSASVVVSPEAFEATKTAVQDFRENAGKALHAELETLDKTVFKNSSYICDMWYDMYFESRDPVPINSNPQLTFKDETDINKRDQAARAGGLISSSVAFFRTLRDGHLEPEIFHTNAARSKTPLFEAVVPWVPEQLSWYAGYLCGAYALDMSQHERLFNLTRIPKHGKDVLKQYPDSKHVVVQRGANFYTFDVLRADGTAVPHAQIEANIRAILALPLPDATTPAVSLLTTLDRNTWADAREKLLKIDGQNKQTLEVIDSAMFAVSLDDTAPDGLVDESHCMLHGTGENRWFDKSFQLIITKNGKAAVNFEHSWGDGVAVLKYFNEVYDATKALPALAQTSLPAPSLDVKQVSFTVDPELASVLDSAKSRFDAQCQSLDLQPLETDVVNGQYLKSRKIGGDGTLQMAFQLAHYRMFGHSASTYESKSTSGFKHGRTECIRSATPLSDEFCRVFVDQSSSLAARDAILRKAVQNHGSLTKDALMGEGWDRHLFALRTLAQRHGGTLPAVFTDEAYTTLGNIVLSTSTLVSDALGGGGFGPVGPDCFGIMYTMTPEQAMAGVISYQRGTAEFLEHLQTSINDIRAALDHSAAP